MSRYYGIPFGKQNGTKTRMDKEPTSPKKPMPDLGICNVCNIKLSYNWRTHINYCDSLQLEEINDKFTNDSLATISTLVIEYKISHNKLRSILLSKFGWTKQSMYEKGLVAKKAKHKAAHATGKYKREKDGKIKPKRRIGGMSHQCGCGILVKRKGQLCKWCVLESHGIRSYHDMLGDD